MGKRKAKCYREFQRPNTRSEYGRRIGVPEGIRKSTFGNTKIEFPAKVRLIANKDVQVSARAIVSIRIAITRELRIMGDDKFRLDMKAYPHHMARSHGLIGVRKAERISSGMGKCAWGLPEMRLARVQKGHPLVEIGIEDNPTAYGLARKALHIATCKLPPTGWTVTYEGISHTTMGAKITLPKRVKEKKGSEQVAELQRELA